MILSQTAIRKPVTTLLLTAAILFFGYSAFQNMGVDLFPEVEFPTVTVISVLPGADPEIMDSDVTGVLEEEINTIEGVKNIVSASTEGQSQIIVEFALSKNADIAAQEVRDKVNIAQAELPRDLEPPIVQKIDIASQPIMWIAVTTSEDYRRAARYADEVLKERLLVAESGPTEEQIEIARCRVAESEAVTARARQDLEDTVVRAPFAGVITRRHLKVGDYVSRGEPVLDLADISYLEVETRIPERYAQQVELAIPAQITIESLGIERAGVVIAVSEAIDQATRTSLVKVGIDNSDYSLKAGVFCTCDFQLPPLEDALAVPHVAVQHREGNSFVWIESSGRVQRVDVALGARNDGFVQVLNGLAGDEQVVIAGAGALSEDDEIEVAVTP